MYMYIHTYTYTYTFCDRYVSASPSCSEVYTPAVPVARGCGC